MSALDVRITGRVQGVFFRDGAATEARRLGVTGWVANEDDGSVSAHLEGPDDAVAELVEWCHEGPPKAQVDEVLTTPADPTGAETFESR